MLITRCSSSLAPTTAATVSSPSLFQPARIKRGGNTVLCCVVTAASIEIAVCYEVDINNSPSSPAMGKADHKKDELYEQRGLQLGNCARRFHLLSSLPPKR
jgi:hypothetical protein